MEKYINRFKLSNEWLCILILLITSYVIIIPSALLNELFPSLTLGENPMIGKHPSIYVQFCLAVIIAPIIETLLFQTLPVFVLKDGLNLRYSIICFVSATAFAASHPFSIGYIIFSFIMGLLFVYAYLLISETPKSPFRIVCITHGLRNFLALVATHYF